MTAGGKLAVVLMNLGGPSGTETIRPFLFNFFMDKNIISLPQPLRWLLAQWISRTRSKGAAKDSYGHLNGTSPLLANTQTQARALEALLQKDFPGARVFVSMRYWHPLADETVQEVAAFAPDKTVLLPLYPQFSTTTAFSSLQSWQRAVKKQGLDIPAAEVCCYYAEPGFIAASAELIRRELERAPKKIRLLFSAHGLPQKVVDAGDPYQWQCEQTAEAIVRALGVEGLDWQMCYQSKVGRLRWTEPSLETALEKAADDQLGVIIYPLAFVSEHVETLVELDIEYKERAEHMGLLHYGRAPTVGTHPAFIRGLADIVAAKVKNAVQSRACPPRCVRCYCGGKK